MKKQTPAAKRKANARDFLAKMRREYDRSERALIRAAIVGCVREDPTAPMTPNDRELSESSRVVDVSYEVQQLRFDRNELTIAERELRQLEAAFVERAEAKMLAKVKADPAARATTAKVRGKRGKR